MGHQGKEEIGASVGKVWWERDGSRDFRACGMGLEDLGGFGGMQGGFRIIFEDAGWFWRI